MGGTFLHDQNWHVSKRPLTMIRKKKNNSIQAYLIGIFLFTLFCYGCNGIKEEHDFWAKTYGTEGPDIAFSIQQTSDGGYIVGGDCGKKKGNTIPEEYDYFFCVYKLNSFGAVEWSVWNPDFFHGGRITQQTSDGGYIGITNGIIKLDEFGEMEWIVSSIGNYSDNNTTYTILVTSIQQTLDGGYVIYGRSEESSLGNPEMNNIWMMKLDSEMGVEWQKSYRGTKEDDIGDWIQTYDSGFIIRNSNSWVIKLDKDGEIQWQKKYETDSSVSSMSQTSDGGYILVGSVDLSYDEFEPGIWLMKIDSTGLVQWEKVYLGSHKYDCVFIQQTVDGGYIIGGSIDGDGFYGQSDIFIVKLYGNGDLEWVRGFGGDKWDGLGYASPLVASDGGYVLAGYTVSFGRGSGDFDAWILKLSSDGTISDACDEQIYKDVDLVPIDNYEFNTYSVDTAAIVIDTKYSITKEPPIPLKDVKLSIHTQCAGDRDDDVAQ